MTTSTHEHVVAVGQQQPGVDDHLPAARQRRGGVGLQGILAEAASTTTLVEQNGSHMRRMEQLAVPGPTTAARAAMQEQDWAALRVA